MMKLGVRWGDDEGGEGKAGAGLGGGSLGHPPIKRSETGCLVEGNDPAEAYLPCDLWLRVSPLGGIIQIELNGRVLLI